MLRMIGQKLYELKNRSKCSRPTHGAFQIPRETSGRHVIAKGDLGSPHRDVGKNRQPQQGQEQHRVKLPTAPDVVAGRLDTANLVEPE